MSDTGGRTLSAILADRRALASMVRYASVPTALALVIGVVVAGVARGAGAAVSYACAVVIVAAFFALGQLALSRLLAGPAELAVAVAMGVYVVQLTVVFALLVVLRQAPWLHVNAFAAGAIGATILWQAGLVVGLRRARQPVYATPAEK